ncbi:MAG: hypothetical protein HY511_00010, partial [Actinobacteria bacterium]|nr:hypothetical protein [Actinomycetota bacterium]
MAAGQSSEAGTRRAIEWAALVLVLAAIGYANRLFGGEPDEDIVFRYAFGFSALIQYGLICGLMLVIARRSPRRELFALRSPARIRR